MRVGFNPHKDQPQEASKYIHQIVIPVFIPNQEGYFKDSFKIFKLSLESLFATVHSKTFITIVNNGSDKALADYLDTLLVENKIHELIHTANIGKLNAILKGLSGHNIELITIADSDVLFLSHWQLETNKVFSAFPKAGVVGIVPQYRTFASHCCNVIFDYLGNKRLKFISVKNPDALKKFYTSIGWGDANPDYLKISLGLEKHDGFKVYMGSGHFVATYKRNMFDEIVSYIGYKMGGDSETYLDAQALKKDYWRLTTHDNFAFHMGNKYENWMSEITFTSDDETKFESGFPISENIGKIHYYIKNQLFRKIFKNKKFRRLFYRYKKMPRNMIAKY